jgi:hypothetical protein
MAVMTGGRVRTAPGTAVFAALVLVLAFGSPAYASWAKDHAAGNNAGDLFLRTLAWPSWSFSSSESVRNLLADDVKAILLIVLTGVFVSLLAGAQLARARGSLNQFFAGWAGYMFAAAGAGLLAAFIQTDASLLGAFLWAAAGVTYGLFVGWIVGLATLGARR